MADPMVRRGAARGWSALAADPRALARVLDGAPYPAWIQRVDEAGFPNVAINDAAAAAYGRTSMELLGQLASETIPPDDFVEYQAAVRDAVERRAPITRRFTARSEGGERYYDMVLTPLIDEDGAITQIFGISRDITDETTSMRSAAERFRSVFHASHDTLVLIAPDGTCLDANPAAGSLLGLRFDEVPGRNLGDFLGPDLDLATTLAGWVRDEPPSGLVTIHRRDGSTRLADYYAIPHVQPDVHLVMARDVTDQVAAEEALRESEARFRVLADSAPALIWTSAADGRPEAFNRGWLEFRGRSLEDELTAPAYDSVHPDDRERCLTVFQTALATQNAYSVTHRLLRADGEYRWLLSRASPRRLADGTFLGFVGASIDVTDQVQAEAALRVERDHQRAVMAALQDALIESDPQGRITAANERFHEMTGFTPDEVIGREIPYPWWPEEERDRLISEALTALRDGQTEVDSTFCRRDGTRFPVALSVSTLQDADGATAVVGTVRDMTAREEAAEALRRSEERSRAVIENAPDMIALLDGHGNLLEASPSVSQTLGLEPADFVGRPIFDLIHPDDREKVLAVFSTRRDRSGSGRTIEFRLAASDGTWRDVEAVGNNLLDDAAVGAIVVNARDVTERRRLEDQLQQAQKLEAVGRLAGGIAHDFNNLLTAISGYAELLLADIPADFEQRDDVEELARAADRATALVEQLLAFARKQDVRPTVLDVHQVITSMEGMLRRLLGPAVGLAVGGPGLPADIRADRTQMEQVFMNLVVNARDACPPSGGQVVVRTELIELPSTEHPDPVELAPGRYVVVSVRDDGAGMDDATKAQAFEPFFTTKEGKGTGLGLSIVYGIVHQSNGHLTVDSMPGSGTTVRVYLPYVAEPPNDSEPTAEDREPASADPLAGSAA